MGDTKTLEGATGGAAGTLWRVSPTVGVIESAVGRARLVGADAALRRDAA